MHMCFREPLPQKQFWPQIYGNKKISYMGAFSCEMELSIITSRACRNISFITLYHHGIFRTVLTYPISQKHNTRPNDLNSVCPSILIETCKCSNDVAARVNFIKSISSIVTPWRMTKRTKLNSKGLKRTRTTKTMTSFQKVSHSHAHGKIELSFQFPPFPLIYLFPFLSPFPNLVKTSSRSTKGVREIKLWERGEHEIHLGECLGRSCCLFLAFCLIHSPPNRPFHNAGASKSFARRFWTT